MQPFVGDDEVFLANYADGLSDLAARHATSTTSSPGDKVACFLSVPLPQSFHVVHTATPTATSPGLEPVATSALRINAGFFVLRQRDLRRT